MYVNERFVPSNAENRHLKTKKKEGHIAGRIYALAGDIPDDMPRAAAPLLAFDIPPTDGITYCCFFLCIFEIPLRLVLRAPETLGTVRGRYT